MPEVKSNTLASDNVSPVCSSTTRPLKINVCCAERFEKKIQLKNANDNIPATVFFMLSMLHYFFLSTNPYLLEYALTLNIPQTSPLILLFTLVGVGE